MIAVNFEIVTGIRLRIISLAWQIVSVYWPVTTIAEVIKVFTSLGNLGTLIKNMGIMFFTMPYNIFLHCLFDYAEVLSKILLNKAFTLYSSDKRGTFVIIIATPFE